VGEGEGRPEVGGRREGGRVSPYEKVGDSCKSEFKPLKEINLGLTVMWA